MSDYELDWNRKQVETYIDEIEGMAITRLFRVSYIIRALHKWQEPGSVGRLSNMLSSYRNRRIVISHDLHLLSLQDSFERVRHTKQIVETAGIELTLLTDQDSPRLASACVEYHLKSISLPIPSGPDFSHAHDGHLNHKGQVRMAELLFQALTNGWSQCAR